MLHLTRTLTPLMLGACALLAADPAPAPAPCPGAADLPATSSEALKQALQAQADFQRQHRPRIDPAVSKALMELKPGAQPAEIEAILAQIQADMAKTQVQGVALNENGASSSISTGIADADGVMTTYSINTRKGKPWLVATRNGKELFSGPVGTAEERALVPEELITGAQGLGLDFNVEHKRTQSVQILKVQTGGAGPDETAQ